MAQTRATRQRAVFALTVVGAAWMASISLGCHRHGTTPSALEPAPQVDQTFVGLVPTVHRAGGHDRAPIDGLEAPQSLRPCCAFGHGLRLSLAGVPVWGLRVDNVVGGSDLGEHRYDGGVVSVDGHWNHGLVALEANGMAYTCRGGFVDTSHVRDYADWTFFLTHRIESMLAHGGRIELPDEGGQRFIYTVAADPRLVERVGRRELALALAQWLAFQISVWHEAATWYGWSSLSAFPELVSAFSPEDLYSNRLGIELASAIIRAGQGEDAASFNHSMQAALPTLLDRLGAVPPAVTHWAMTSVDVAHAGEGGWWDSRKRLPAKNLVVRRNFDLGPDLRPWQIPPHKQPPELARALRHRCGASLPAPVVLVQSEAVSGVPLRRLAKLDVRLSERIDESFPGVAQGRRWVAQDEFPQLVVHMRAMQHAEHGADSDRP